MTKKNVVVTGGSGRLGRYVVERLKLNNHVTVLDANDAEMADLRPGLPVLDIRVQIRYGQGATR